jgi:hypothetical protein
VDYAQAYYDLPPVNRDGPGTFLFILLVFALFVVAIVWVLYKPSPPENPFPKPIIRDEINSLFDPRITKTRDGWPVGVKQLEDLQKGVLDRLRAHGVIP